MSRIRLVNNIVVSYHHDNNIMVLEKVPLVSLALEIVGGNGGNLGPVWFMHQLQHKIRRWPPTHTRVP